MTALLIVDPALLDARRVLWSIDDEKGLGFETKLECGHYIWFAVRPPAATHCASCLEQLVKQIREIQAHQEPR